MPSLGVDQSTPPLHHVCCLLSYQFRSGQAIEEDGLQKNCLAVGTHLLLELAKLRDEFEIVGDVRGKGLMIGIQMVKDKVRIALRRTEVCVLHLLPICLPPSAAPKGWF